MLVAVHKHAVYRAAAEAGWLPALGIVTSECTIQRFDVLFPIPVVVGFMHLVQSIVSTDPDRAFSILYQGGNSIIREAAGYIAIVKEVPELLGFGIIAIQAASRGSDPDISVLVFQEGIDP
jgi:hypothetical protein